MKLELSYSFGSPEVPWVLGNKLVHLCGNSVAILNFMKDKTCEYIWGQGSGIQNFAISKTKHLIAVWEHENRPAIQIYSYPDKERLHTLQGCDERDDQQKNELRLLNVVFSRDGTLLASLGDAPDSRLIVWDWEREIQLATVKDLTSAVAVSFNPQNRFHLVVLTPNQAISLLLERQYQKCTVHRSQAMLPARGTAMPDSIVSHVWATDNEVYVGTQQGVLYKLTTGSAMEFTEILSIEAPLNSLLLTTNHILAACGDGILRWFSLTTNDCCRAMRFEVTQAPLVHIDTDASFGTLCVCSASGGVYMLNIRREPPTIATNEALEEDQKNHPKVLMIYDHHRGPITGVAFTSPSTLATCSADGTMRVWEHLALSPPEQEDSESEDEFDEEDEEEDEEEEEYDAEGNPQFRARPRRRRRRHMAPRDLRMATTSTSHTTKALTKVVVGSPLSALASAYGCPTNRHIVVAGSSRGVLRFYSMRRPYTPVLLHRVRLFDGPVTAIRFHPEGTHLAVISAPAKRVYFLSTRNVSEATVLGYVALPFSPLCLGWSKDAGPTSHLFVPLANGDVYRFVPPHGDTPSNTDSETLEIPPYVVQRNILKTEYPLDSIALVPRDVLPDDIASLEHRFFALARDKRLKHYGMNIEMGDPDLMSEDVLASPEIDLPGHDAPGMPSSLALSPQTRLVAVVARDGQIVLRALYPDAGSRSPRQAFLRKHDFARGGATCACFSPDGKHLITVGNDGVGFAWPIPQSLWDGADDDDFDGGDLELDGQEVPIEDRPDADDEPTFLEARRLQEEAMENAVHSMTHSRFRQQVRSIEQRLNEMIRRNERAPPLERLDRLEFCLNLSLRDQIQDETEEFCQSVRNEQRKKNDINEIVRERVRSFCWDTMEVHGLHLLPFVDQRTIVSNYPIRHLTPEEERSIGLVRMMRRLELRSFRDYDPAQLMHDIEEQPPQSETAPEAESQMTSRSNISARPMSAIGSSHPGTIAPSPTDAVLDDDDAQFTSDAALLYQPLQVYTPQRRIAQIYLLRCVIREIQRAFNGRFDALMQEKANVLEKVAHKNTRIREIHAELKVPESVEDPVLSPDEIADSCFTVDESLISAKKILSEEEQRALAEQQAREEAKKRAGEDDAGQRALMEMMDGRLQARSEETSLDYELEKPEWMLTTPAKKMTEEQIKLVREFEEKEKTLRDEKEKYRRALDTELKTLQEQIRDIKANFDAELKRLFMEKLQTDKAVLAKELYIIKIASSLLQQEMIEKKAGEFHKQLSDLSQEKSLYVAECADLERVIQGASAEIQHIMARIKMIDGECRQRFREREYFKKIMALYRLRTRQKNVEPPERDLTALDPFSYHDVLTQFDADAAIPVELDRHLDVVDWTIDDADWELLVQLRSERLASDQKLKQQNAELSEMKAYHASLVNQRMEIDRQISRILDDREKLHKNLLRHQLNMDLIFTLKQGQIEVPQTGKVVTDYAKAVAVQRDLIEAINQEIQVRGKAKVDAIEANSAQRNTLRGKEWRKQELMMLIEDERNKVSDFKMLRVTKKLQDLAQTGNEEQKHQQEIAQLEKQRVSLRDNHGGKMAELHRHRRRYARQIRRKQEQNRAFDERIRELEVAVSERQKIYVVQSMQSDADSKRGSNSRMKEIRERRRLLDYKQQQEEDLRFLREELDRLRQKTFPSFAQLRNQPSGNVDER